MTDMGFKTPTINILKDLWGSINIIRKEMKTTTKNQMEL